MSTLQEQIAKAEQEHANKIAKLRQEHDAREALAAQVPGLEAYSAPRIYVSPLYGRVGSITFKTERYTSLQDKDRRQPDRALVALLMAALPGLPVTKWKDSCLSFRTTAYVDALPDDKIERVDLTPVAPWLIKADPNHFSETVEIEWYAEVGGQVWEISVEFPRYACTIGQWDIILKRTPEGDIRLVERCQLRAEFPEAPEPPQVVRWASGGHTSLNSFTLWWYDNEPEVREHIQRGILATLPEGKEAPRA